MKIRNEFVSNSSSSSFCMLGVYVGMEFNEFTNKYKCGWSHIENSFLKIQEGLETSDCVVGLSPTDFDENKTIKQIKEEIRNELIRVGLPSNVDWIEESNYC